MVQNGTFSIAEKRYTGYYKSYKINNCMDSIICTNCGKKVEIWDGKNWGTMPIDTNFPNVPIKKIIYSNTF